MPIPQDQIYFLIGILFSVPFSYALRFIQNPTHRLIYSFVLGTVLQYFVYGIDIWMPFLIHIFIYLIVKAKGRKSGALVTGISILLLSIYHIYRMLIDYGSWILDISTILMPMVCKYSLFAYAYQDGGKQKQKMTEHQYNYRIQKMPSFFQYLVYCQFLPTCIINTSVQYKDFQNFMYLQAPFDKKIPSKMIFNKVIIQFGYSLLCAAIYFTGVLFYPISIMQQYSFAQLPALYIIYFSFFSVTFARFKYYFGWKFSQCAVHASGISYNSEGEQHFQRVKTCDPWKVESTLHLRDKVAYWNMSSELWLRRCIYERATFKNKQTSQAFVFIISSFWHGFYGGYYISFFMWFLQINLSAKVFKFVQQNQGHLIVRCYKSMGKLGYILLWIFVNLLFSHVGTYFQILDSHIGFYILKKLYFSPLIIIILGIIMFGTVFKGKRSNRSPKTLQQKKQEKKIN